MSVIFTPRAAAHLARRRRHRPAVVLPRARRLPGRGRDRQVRLHAHAHGLPAPLPAEVLGVRGGRRPARHPHPILREALVPPLAAAARWRSPRSPTSPPGTGHGLLRRVHGLPAEGARARRRACRRTPGELAEAACEIEIDVLKEPVGKQDQYVAAHGGICAYTFNPDGTRRRRAARALGARRSQEMRDNFLLFYTGEARSAADDPRRPGQAHPRAGDARDAREPPPHEGDRAREPRAARGGRPRAPTRELMHEHWENKRKRSPGWPTSTSTSSTRSRAQRRGRRQARRRRRRRVPARLRARDPTTRARRWPAAGAPELRVRLRLPGLHRQEYA